MATLTKPVSYVLTLKRRADRLAKFYARVADVPNFPFQTPIPHYAADGKKTGGKDGWMDTAWACKLSHLHIWEQALTDDTFPIVIFEDDAIFCPNFAQKVSDAWMALPDNWGMFYIGGIRQHACWGVDKPYNLQLAIPFCMTSMQTYAFGCASFCKEMYRVMVDNKEHVNSRRRHIDWQLCYWQQAHQQDNPPRVFVLSNNQSFTGQSADYSDNRREGVKWCGRRSYDKNW
jgi:hypothetical protein